MPLKLKESNSKEIMNNLSKESGKGNEKVNEAIGEVNDEYSKDIIEEGSKVHAEHNINHNSAIPEIKLEVYNETNEDEYLENNDSDLWVLTAKDKEEVYDNKNIFDILDISEEKLSNVTDGILSVRRLYQTRRKCNLCPKDFLFIEDCVAHKLKDHEGVKTPYKCPICKKTFDTKRHRKRHMENHSSEQKFGCTICSKTLKNSDSLRGHIKRFHSDIKQKLHSCLECDFTTKDRMVLKKHMINKHSSETQFQCRICCKSFASDCFLKYHMAVHSSDKPFACEICNKRFKIEGERQRHMLSHALEKPFECTECDNKYATKQLLKKHMPSHIPNENRPHPCDQCDKRFNNISTLNLHKKKHTGVLEAICDICGKGFQDPYYLKQHKMMHTDERPLKCEICGKGFRSSGHLDLHIKYHKKIVTAFCPICGFGAPTKSVLNTHIKNVHTNETPYECDICGNKYKTKGNLSKHKRGIRGTCKGFNTLTSSVQEKREVKTSQNLYFEQNESKQDSLIPLQETTIATSRMPAEQNYSIHPSLLLYTNSLVNSNDYPTQYHGSLIPPNSRGITETVHISPISY